MKKLKFALIVLVLLTTLSGYSQEEFFGNINGLTLSGSLNFNNSIQTETKTGGLSLYLKNGLIFSGSYSKIDNNEFVQANFGYLFNNSKNDNGLKGLIGISIGNLFNNYKILGLNMGTTQVFYRKSNFPFSLAGVATLAIGFEEDLLRPYAGLSLGYTQSFFANGSVYPVIGISKSFIIGQNSSDWFLHAGLNIKLS